MDNGNVGLKTCSACGIEKPVSEYYKGRNSCKECKREYDKGHYEANREKARENSRKWHEANREKARENNRKWHEANREKSRESSRKWHKANPEKAREISRKWKKANPEKARETGRAGITEIKKWYVARQLKLKASELPKELYRTKCLIIKLKRAARA